MFIRNGVSDIFSRFKQWAGTLQVFRSLRFRIFIMIVLTGMIPCLVLRTCMVRFYEQRAVELKTSEVQNQCLILANHLFTNNYLNDTSDASVNAELEQISNLYEGRVLIIDGDLRIVKDTYNLSRGRTMVSDKAIMCMRREAYTDYDAKSQQIEIATPIEDKSRGEVIGAVLTSVSTASITDTMGMLSRNVLIITVILFFIIVILAYFLSYVLITPFNKIVEALGNVQEGFEQSELYVPDYMETENLYEALKRMMEQMRILDESRQEFVSNVSHELKTPITSIKVLADSLIANEEAPIELYQEFMTDIAAEISREDQIITDLLSLVKMDKTSPDLNIELKDINEIVESILKRLRPIARQRNIELVFESIRAVSAEVDEVKLTLAISNLVENAIKYNREDGSVTVTLDADHQFFMIEVKDTGIGIPLEDQAHIFERFYRVDKSHSREIGGTGLGLAIAKNAIQMHKGAVKVESEENVGTTFYVKIPKIYISDNKPQ